MSAAEEDPRLPVQQAIIDRAYACLEAMRERTKHLLSLAQQDAKLTDALDAAAIQNALFHRLEALADSNAPLTFGRIDEEGASKAGSDAARYFIGRRHVEDANGDPVVVDWRAPVSAPFYRATWADPQGLDARSRFALDGRQLVGTFDEDFTDPEGAERGGSGGVPDPLLAELERGRSGAMRDIVATIQAEQDVIIRAPMNELIVVQGGPGTGKTAVGLHRAAFLLYSHRAEFARRKLLVVGPNRLFLTYIAQVLPSLGETSVVQTTVDSMTARAFPIRATEDREVARLKGDRRMALVVRRAVLGRIASAQDVSPLDVMTAFGGAQVDAPSVGAILDEVTERTLPTNAGREVFRDQLVAEAWRQRSRRLGVSPESQHAFTGDLPKQPTFRAYVDRVWPAMSAAGTVRSLFGTGRAVAAADGLLDSAERRLLRRVGAKKVADERWTRADIALLDEANHLITGDTPQFGHVVVDEAQDLSAMELRMVARRSPERSMTILGDLAQSTGIGGSTSWANALAELGHGRVDGRGRERDAVPGHIDELELGYRVPAVLIEFANRLLPVAAPGLRPSRSVRDGGEAPWLVRVDEPGLLPAMVATQAQALVEDWGVVGVLAPPSLLDDVVGALTDAGVVHRDARKAVSIEDGITVVAAELAKGLEFDAIVVVEPMAIADDHDEAGYRVLYVALTRATQRVTIVHARDLPEELDDNVEPTVMAGLRR